MSPVKNYPEAISDLECSSKAVSRVAHGLIGGKLSYSREFRHEVLHGELGEQAQAGT